MVAVREGAVRPIVLFRCDASPAIGGGHVMRCLALAEDMKLAGYRPVFVSTEQSACTVPALAASGAMMVPTASDSDGVTDAAAHGIADAACAVVDHYGLGADAERSLQTVARQVVVFEDIPGRAHVADILVDPTPARGDAYAALVPATTQLLLGPAHAMIARRWREAHRHGVGGRPGERAKVVVSMGATDAADATGRVLDAIAHARIDAAVEVVIGSGAPHLAALRARCGDGTVLHVDPADLPAIIASADLVVGAPGSSAFERALLGVPSLLIPVAGNQADIAAAFAAAGVAEVVPAAILTEPAELGGRIAAVLDDAPRRTAMGACARALCDGRGTQRLLCALAGTLTTGDGHAIALRLAEAGDCDWLFDLQSDPTTRRYARNPAAPTRSEHEAWLARSLADPNRMLMIASDGGVPVGMVRLDRLDDDEGGAFEVSIGIAREARGKGYGAAALALARRAVPGATLEATVLPANDASVALFLGAGYARVDETSYRCLPQ
jgi:UDP-2,4-diacetamido-2,4,6-trideoxy-beta-L-altropyranose hydrolase